MHIPDPADLPPPLPRPQVYLRDHALSEHRIRELGATSLSDLAARCGLAHTTLLRARDGAPCGTAVIAALLTATRLPFEELFVLLDA